MSQHATELCLLLVDESYGELTSRIFGVLICYGRLAFPAILHHSGLTSRQVKHGLAVLVQQHLALWYSSDTTTYYEADWTNAYALVRLGKLIKFIENRFDAAAGEVLSTLVLSGHAQVADLARAYTVSRNGVVPGFVAKKAAFTNGDLPNGHSKHQQNGHVPSFDAIHSALQTLLASGFLTVAHESHFRPDIDNRAIAHKQCEAYTQFQAPLKGEKRLEFAQAVDGLLHEWKFGSSVYHSKNMSTKGKKRLRDEDCEDAGGLKKKVRSETFVNGLNSTLSHNGDAVMVKIEDEDILQVNTHKLAVILRNERLVQLAKERIGVGASRVYAELLRKLENHYQCCTFGETMYINSDDDLSHASTPTVTTVDIATAMEKLEDLSGGIGTAEASKININRIINPKKRSTKINYDDADAENDADEDEDSDDFRTINAGDMHDEADDESNDDDGDAQVQIHKKTSIVPKEVDESCFTLTRQNLLLLAEHPYRFVTFCKRTYDTLERWSVNFHALAHRLRLIEIEKTLRTRYGSESVRVIRILQEKGKLDEKAIASLSLLNQRTMRSILNRMHGAGHVELQEIPRDTQRQPSRTMFLWYFDVERCRRKLLEETYKTMARCLQRVKSERGLLHNLMEKAARSDVKGREAEFLKIEEQATLEKWRSMEERLLGEIGRLDDVVAVLRDF